jgi:hypothetical protein
MQIDGSICFQNGNLEYPALRLGCLQCHNPLLSIRLPTYPPKLIDGNLKGLGCTGFARHYYRHRCLLSFPRGTKMFQFPRLPLSNPMCSDSCHAT